MRWGIWRGRSADRRLRSDINRTGWCREDAIMENIDREHPEYVAKKAMWKKYRDLYSGGEQIRGQASDYLVRRSKEPNDVYQERLNRVFYENYIGSIIDWYSATLLRREPVLVVDGPNEAGKHFF